MKKQMSVILLLLVLMACSGCSKEKIQVEIKDGQVTTKLSVVAGSLVEDALKQAEITVSEKDIVTPAKNETMSKEDNLISISRNAKVVIEDRDGTYELSMTGKTVQDVLDEKDIILGDYDYINHDRSAYLYDGMTISIIRQKGVSIEVDGEKIECISQSETVGELLKEHKIVLGDKDRVVPTENYQLMDYMNVKVERISWQEVVERERIDFETITEYSDAYYAGETVKKTEGKKGIKEVTYKITMVDGKEASRKKAKEKVIKKPVSQVIIKGTKQKRSVVSKEKVEDCDGSGHGYYIVTWSDGEVEYIEY